MWACDTCKTTDDSGGHPKPLRHLMAQNAMAHGDGATFVALFALAGDDQNQPFAGFMRRKDEACQRGMCPFKRHAVQVDPPFGSQLAALQLAEGLLIHLHRGLVHLIGQGRHQVVRAWFDGRCRSAQQHRLGFAQRGRAGCRCVDLGREKRFEVQLVRALRDLAPQRQIILAQPVVPSAALHIALSGSRA